MCLIAILTVLVGIALRMTKPDSKWWYDTLFCFCFGAFYSELKAKFEDLLKKNRCNYYAILLLLLLCMTIGFIGNAIVYNIAACAFCLIVIMLTMKIKICNPVLVWLGRNLFPIYIFQRIPMIILSHYGVYQPVFFVGVSLASTFCITLVYNSVTSRTDQWCFRQQNK